MTIQATQPNTERAANANTREQPTTNNDSHEEKHADGNEYLAAIKDGSKKTYEYVSDHVVQGAKATDKAVHKYPYAGIAVSAGAGALLGVLFTRLFSRRSN